MPLGEVAGSIMIILDIIFDRKREYLRDRGQPDYVVLSPDMMKELCKQARSRALKRIFSEKRKALGLGILITEGKHIIEVVGRSK